MQMLHSCFVCRNDRHNSLHNTLGGKGAFGHSTLKGDNALTEQAPTL